jgi:hypothetical protein
MLSSGCFEQRENTQVSLLSSVEEGTVLGVLGAASLYGAPESEKTGETEIVPPTTAPLIPVDPTDLPDETLLSVPFYAQAPFGDWVAPYLHTCEEASLLLAYHYVTEQALTVYSFDEALLAMVNWENDYFGDYQHTSIEETADILENYLGFEDFLIVDNPTVEDLKGYLAAGHPIVAPFAGQYLPNPYFGKVSPVYHMLTITGYNDWEFITNDVGTKNGEAFVYDIDVLMDALHDWHPDADLYDDGILNGGKRVLVLQGDL